MRIGIVIGLIVVAALAFGWVNAHKFILHDQYISLYCVKVDK